MKTHRRSVALTQPQLKWLETKARKLGITVAEVLRRIVDDRREKEDA